MGLQIEETPSLMALEKGPLNNTNLQILRSILIEPF